MDDIIGLPAISSASDLVPQVMPVARSASRAPSPGGLAKAYIAVEGESKRLEGWFNPNKYRRSRANSWNESQVVGQDRPPLQFGGGQAQRLSIELLFDASEDANGDVRPTTEALFAAMDVMTNLEPGKNAGRPPTVTFVWGGTRTFTAVIEQLSIDFTFFRPDGVPVRALAQLELRQADDLLGANTGAGAAAPRASAAEPASGAPGTHTVRAGDSLQSIATDSFGDPTRWREIAEFNNIDNPLNLVNGAVLSIPRGVRAVQGSVAALRGQADAFAAPVRGLRSSAIAARGSARSLRRGLG